MSPLDFNSVEGGQARLEAVAKAKESPQDLKQRLAQYRQTYINEVDSQQRTLNADANAFVARDAQQYLKDAAKSLGNSVVNLAVEGENLQRRGIAAAAAPAEKPAARPAGKPALPLDKQATLDFSTLAGLKKAVQSELADQAGELAVWRQIEQIGGKFEKGWQNYQKTFATAPSLEGLSANLAARQAQKTTLEGIRKQYEAINPTAGSLRAWQEDSRDMAVFLTRIDLHLKEGEKVLETHAALTAQQTALGTLEKKLRAAKTLTAEEFAQHLSSLQQSGQSLSGLQEQIRLGREGAGEFDTLYVTLQQQYHQPLSDRVTLLHGLLEAKKPADDKETKATPAEVEHQFRLFIGGAQSTLSAIDKRVGTLEKELAAAAKKPELWLNRDDYDAWLSRLDTELGAANEIKNGLDSWEQKSDQAAAAKDFINRHFQPALRRAQSLRDRADRERGEAIKNNEKKIINQKVAEMHGQLLKEWQGKKESEQYLSIADKLAALKPEDKEYQTLTAKQDALAKDLISFEGKVAFLLSKPDDLEKDVLAALQKLQADCRQWQNQIGGDRVLRQSRAAAATEPDQPHTYTVERRTRAFVKAGPTGGGHWEDRVEKEEKTEHYKFSQYVQFVNIHDPKHAPAPGKEGRGWIWINGGEKLPDPVKKAMSNRADLIVSEQKEQVQERSSRERREIRQQDLLTPRGREVLGADAARYFAGVDFLAKGDIRKAMAEFDAYLEQSKNFDADKRELHSGCIEDATRQVESHREFPEYLNALKLQAEGKIDEAIKQFRAFLSRVNAKFGGAMGPDQVGPENPARQKYAEQIGVAIEVIRKFNNDKLKILDELSQDFIYLQTVDTARRSGKVNPLDFANLKGAQRELMLPYIPAKDLTPAERIRQSRQLGGLQGGEVGAIKDAIKNLRDKIEKGDPPVDFETEFASIRADLKKYTETTPGGTVWKNPDTNEVVANSPSSRLLAYFQQINSSDPAAREKGFLAIAAEFKDQEVGMRYTQKYLRQAMVARYRAFAGTAEGQTVAAAVRRRLAADPATNNEITLNARELYKRWAAEQKPPLPAEPPNPVVMQSFKKTIADSIFEDQYEREMRRAMTSRGNAADEAARDLYLKNRIPGRRLTPWKDLSRENKLAWLAQVADGDLGVALLDGGALKQYNWSRPYDEANAKWYKPWSWQNYNEDDYNDFKAQAAEIAIQTVATLPIGWGAGAVGRAVGLGAVKLLVREGLTEAAFGALSRGGLRALMVAEKAGEKAIWTTLSSGMKARLLLHYGVGIAAEGATLALMNSVWEGMYHGRSDLFDSLDAGKYGKAGLVILENIAKAGLFRGIGAGQMGVSGLAGPNAKLLTRILTETGGEALSGVGGAGVEALFMLHDPKMREQLGWEWFAKSVLQNAAGSVAMRAGHSGMRLPEMGVFKGSREGTARRLTAAEIQLNGERLAARGIHSPADISNARIEANGDLVLRLKSGKDQIIKYSEIPFDRLPPEMRNHLYQTDKNNRDSLRAVLQETGLDSPLNWTAVTDNGAVISTTGRIVPIADPALLPPALREKHRLLVEERRQARLGPYRRPSSVEPDQPPVKTDASATKETPGGKNVPDAPRIAPDLPPRQLPPGEAATRRTGIRNTLKLYEQQAKLSADPQKNAAELARLDAQINAAAKAKNLSPEQYLRRLQSDEHLYRGLEALDRGEAQLYGESKVIKKPVLDENNVQKKDANDQPVHEEVNLFANYQSKSAAYSREMLRGISYERLVAEGGGKIIKLGGDELVVYHAGPDGTVQKLFIDISNMGPTNDTATKIAGSKINLVDIYLHRLSEAVLAQSKARQGQLLDPVAFNAEVQRVADSLFNLDRDTGGKPLDAKEAAKRFDRLKAEWGLEGTYQEYLTDIQSMRILAEYRSDTRALDSSYKNHPERTFTEHISAEIQAISGLTIPQLQQLIAANPAEFRTAFEGRLPKSPKLKAMPVDELLQQIKSLDPAKSKPEDLMMLYAMLARMDTSGLAKIPTLKPFTDRLAASRTALVGDPPHPRVEEPRLMDAKVVSIELPPDIAKALSALAETDPVRAHAILATARQFSEKSLDALKYGQRGRFAQFKITDYLELKNGQLQVKPTAKDFQLAVETARTDKKIGNVIDAEDSLRQARSQLETLQKQLNDGEITHREFLSRSERVEIEIGILTSKLSIDPDTGAYGQGYLDVRPTTMYYFADGIIHPQYRVWHSVVTELGHSGVINAKYGYQAMDGIMATYFQVLQQGIAAELPPNLRHFKIIRSGGGKFEVVFLDARAVAHLAQKGLTPHQLIERLATGPGQQAVDKVLQADPKKVAASQTDAAVRNSQFRYNKGTEVITVGRLTSRAEISIDSTMIAAVQRDVPEISARGIIAQATKRQKDTESITPLIVPRDMLLSGFSETPPPNIPKDSPGWIDTGGRIFYNPRALSSALAPGHTVVASEPGQGIRIRTPDNRIVGLGEYRRSVKGTPHEATPHALLEKMREIKNHESMHRVTTMLTDPVSFFAARDQQNALPEGKVELTDVQGKPLPLTRDNVDEFISRVADGTQPITPGQRALLQKAIAEELRAKGIKDFTFEAVRRADTRLLSTNPREAFRRAEAAAKSPEPQGAPWKKVTSSTEFNNLIRTEQAESANYRIANQILVDMVSVIRSGDPKQVEAYIDSQLPFVDRRVLQRLRDEIPQGESLLTRAMLTETGRKTLQEAYAKGELTPVTREIYKLLLRDEGVIRDAFSLVDKQGQTKSRERLQSDLKKIQMELRRGFLASNRFNLETILRQRNGPALIASLPGGLAIIRNSLRSEDGLRFRQLPERVRQQLRAEAIPLLTAKLQNNLSAIGQKVTDLETKLTAEPDSAELKHKLNFARALLQACQRVPLSDPVRVEAMLKAMENRQPPAGFEKVSSVADVFHANIDRLPPESLVRLLEGRVKYDYFSTRNGPVTGMFILGRNLGVGGVGSVWACHLIEAGSNVPVAREMVMKRPLIEFSLEQNITGFDSLPPASRDGLRRIYLKYVGDGYFKPENLAKALQEAVPFLPDANQRLQFESLLGNFRAARQEKRNALLVMEHQKAGRLQAFTRYDYVSSREETFMESLANPKANHAICDFDGIFSQTVTSLNGKTPITPKVVLGGLADVFVQLAEAHQLGLLHRDIKPENIGFGPDGQIRLMDIGSLETKDSYRQVNFRSFSPAEVQALLQTHPNTILLPNQSTYYFPETFGVTPGYYQGDAGYYHEAKGTLSSADNQPLYSWGYSDRVAMAVILEGMISRQQQAGYTGPQWIPPDKIGNITALIAYLRHPRSDAAQAAAVLRKIAAGI